MAVINRARQIVECDLESEMNVSTMFDRLIYTKENGGRWWKVVSGVAIEVGVGTFPPHNSIFPDNADWNSSSGLSQILNKPTLHDVATSGDYADLENLPILSDVAISNDYNDLDNLPSFHAVATSGNYNDLSNKPSINNLGFYGTSGLKTVSKVWSAVVNPNTADGYSINITSAGFTTIDTVSVTASRNTSSAGESPNVSIKSTSTSAIVVNIVEANTSTQNVLLNLLGSTTAVLNGTPMVFANTTGLSLHVVVYGS